VRRTEHNPLTYNLPILRRTDVPCVNSNGVPNTKKIYWRTVSGKHCLLAEGDISAPIYWRTDAPRAITIGGPMVSHLLLAERTEELKNKRWTKQFGAPRLFSSQSPFK